MKKNQYHVPYVETALGAAKGSAANARLNIEIMPAFFELPYRGKDQDTQVETLIHEMSHHAANTDDEKVLGVTCYGLMGVKAARLAGKASNNAENYGYFLSSFQDFA